MYDKELREVREKLEGIDAQRAEEGDRTKDWVAQLSTVAGEIKFLERDLKELEIKVGFLLYRLSCKLILMNYARCTYGTHIFAKT